MQKNLNIIIFEIHSLLKKHGIPQKTINDVLEAVSNILEKGGFINDEET